MPVNVEPIHRDRAALPVRDGPGSYGQASPQRAVAAIVVVALHGLLIFGLLRVRQPAVVKLPAVFAALLLSERPRLPPPPILPIDLKPPPLPPLLPELRIAEPKPPVARHAPPSREALRHTPTISHFGAAGGDTDLGLGLGGSDSGGDASRRALIDFDGEVKRRILAHKVQPAIRARWTQTCLITYRVTVDTHGAILATHIDPCPNEAFNQAALTAIRAGAPFPLPPGLTAPRYDIYGTLIFHP